MVLSLEADLGLVCFSSCCSLDLGEYVAGSSLFLYRLLRQDFDLELEHDEETDDDDDDDADDDLVLEC